jgi:hypothetical protein
MLAQLIENRRTLVGDKVRLSNRIIASLKNYYPQVLEWLEDKDTQVFCDFVLKYPTLKDTQVASSNELTTFSISIALSVRRRLPAVSNKLKKGCR